MFSFFENKLNILYFYAMRILGIILILMWSMTEINIFNFNSAAPIKEWFTTNDDVMGGISTSSMQIDTEGNGLFSGEVSTENNGGFAMTRLRKKLDLTKGIEKIVLRVKGDGKTYQLRIKSDVYQRYWYVQSFTTTTEWQTITLSLTDFYPSFRGYRLPRKNFSATTIEEVAILIGNKKNETFGLVIDRIYLQ